MIRPIIRMSNILNSYFAIEYKPRVFVMFLQAQLDYFVKYVSLESWLKLRQIGQSQPHSEKDLTSLNLALWYFNYPIL